MARRQMQLAASCLLTFLLAVAAVTAAADGNGPIGTVVTLFTGPYFTNVPASDAPVTFRAPPPEASCVNLPSPVAGRVGSAQIQWNVAPADGAGGNRAMCGEVWFWRQQDCEGRGTAWQLKDLASASVDRYDYRRERIPLFPEKFVGAKSMSCAKYLPNACSALTCGANAKCVLHAGEGVCQCKRGFVLKDGQCVDACADAVCPFDARCVVEAGDTAVCHCVNPGFLFADGKCEAVCATRCPSDAQCEVEDGRMKCECPDGKRLRDGACVDPCSGVACPADTSCVAAAGVPRCVCASGVLTATGCVDTTGDAIVDSYLKPHNEARAAVGSPALLWDADLAAKAKAWVATLAQAERCRLEHPAELLESASKPYGQNLAALCCKRRASTARAIDVWVDEGSHYDTAPLLLQEGDGGGCSTGDWRDCGHYTQVVWKATMHVGCASGPCGRAGWTAWVCNYSPPGNEKGLSPY